MNRAPTLEDSRALIDAADRELFSLLAQFNPVAKGEKNILNSQKKEQALSSGYIEMWRNDAPNGLLRCVIDELDLTDKSLEELRTSIRAIARALSKRFHALEGIALDKKAKGETDSYSHARHATVVNRGAEGVEAAGGNSELGRRVFAAIAQKCVDIQNEYLRKDSGPLANYIKSKSLSRRASPPGWLSSQPSQG
ncbi:MAG: hypothetical protein KDI46_02555 [Alphaproteobacteria bacterium]|nr:hypothetical protein [Alphaproteobacteria bacterium]